MASPKEPTPDDMAAWDDFLGRFEWAHRCAFERTPPWALYRLQTTGQRVVITAYAEDGTVTVLVSADYNLVSFEHQVFGVDPVSLEECDPPLDGEPVGEICTTAEEVDAEIGRMREQMFGKPH